MFSSNINVFYKIPFKNLQVCTKLFILHAGVYKAYYIYTRILISLFYKNSIQHFLFFYLLIYTYIYVYEINMYKNKKVLK